MGLINNTEIVYLKSKADVVVVVVVRSRYVIIPDYAKICDTDNGTNN